MNFFGGNTGMSLSVSPSMCLCVHVSVFVQNTSLCQNAGGGIKSHLVTALVYSIFILQLGETNIKAAERFPIFTRESSTCGFVSTHKSL